MSKLRSLFFEENLFEGIRLNFLLFFTPRFIRSRVVRRLLNQLGLMVKHQIPFAEGLRTIASPRQVRIPVHYTMTLIVMSLIFATIEIYLILRLLPIALEEMSPVGGFALVIGAPLFLLMLFVWRPASVLWFFFGVLVICIVLFCLFNILGALILLIFLLFFLRMNIQSVKINDSYLVRRAARELATKLAKGTSLSAAMGSMRRLFLPFHTTMIKTGEATGKMEEVMNQVAEYERWRGRFYFIGIKNFAYPVILFFFAALIISFITIKIVAKLEEIFAQMNATLPAFSTSVINFITSIYSEGILGLLYLVMMAIVIFSLWSSLKYYVPVIRRVARPLSASRFLMALGFQLRAGLPINEAVRVARCIDKGLVFSRNMERLQAQIEKGVPFAAALEQVRIFPRMTKHWVSMAEFAEALDTELIDIARRLAKDGEAGFTKLTTTLEPIVHLIIAFLIGLLVIAFYLPIFNIPGLIIAGGG